MDAAQTAALIGHLEATFGIRYSVNGMTDWLKAHGFTYHQPAVIPAKADAEKQQVWLESYENLKKTLPEDEHIVFMDSIHPTHEVRVVRGWIKKGVAKEIPTNGQHPYFFCNTPCPQHEQ